MLARHFSSGSRLRLAIALSEIFDRKVARIDPHEWLDQRAHDSKKARVPTPTGPPRNQPVLNSVE